MNKLYEKTAARLARAGVKDPTAQIIYLAEEIERYRAKIYGLEEHLRANGIKEAHPLDVVLSIKAVCLAAHVCIKCPLLEWCRWLPPDGKPADWDVPLKEEAAP